MPKERDPSGRFVKTPSDGAQAESDPEAEPADPGNLAQLLAAVGEQIRGLERRQTEARETNNATLRAEEGDIRKISVASMIIVYMAVGLPSMVIWYIAMKVGVCLVPVYTISLSAQKTSMEKKQGTLR